jgi:bacterioferritin
MKGKPEVLKALQDLLEEELGALNQYFLHSEMCENWGYELLSKRIKKLSITEMKHAEELIERLLFLEGAPNLGRM